MKKVLWGLFLILAAVAVIVNQLGYFPNLDLLNLLITIVLIPIFIGSVLKLNFAGILFPIAIFCIIYSKELNLEAITPFPVLIAALLGSIGLSIVFNKHHVVVISHHENFDEVVDTEDDDKVNYSINFGSGIKYVNSENFRKADLRCTFGAMKVYFDNAKIVDDSAIINLDVSFAGVEMYIPKEWEVVNKAEVNLASIEEKNKTSKNCEKKVILRGRVNLGGVEIFYV